MDARLSTITATRAIRRAKGVPRSLACFAVARPGGRGLIRRPVARPDDAGSSQMKPHF